MVKKFCKDNNELIPEDLQKMDCNTLIAQVRQYLESKRYLVLFDDVWNEKFCDEFEHALIKNNKGSRIIVTTRMMHVAEYFKKKFHVHVHKLQPLSFKKAQELFCNNAFRSEPLGQCPAELEDISNEIVKKCEGLPLAIVAISGLLSTKPENIFEWENVIKNLRMELKRNPHLTSLTRILSLSYDHLPNRLKSCMLYFGIYPEDYTINRKRLTRQWMAEGFVIINEEDIRPLEEVAEEYLTELIQRSLVNVSTDGFDGKVKSCHVHDGTVGITRRFSIAVREDEQVTKDLTNTNTSNSGIRAIFIFNKGELSKGFMNGLSAKFKLLKVLEPEPYKSYSSS
ncbi:NBS-containing resistance-like protein [Trifolium medium]|uniref:NBS-containing resistance-like protein n=1 Tax=Trifolium medium TaxID=97028 RepID=A0A392MUI8_9FABA|nr:NBS-containing resistance-like protein [Trifolium medium]